MDLHGAEMVSVVADDNDEEDMKIVEKRLMKT